MNTIDLDQYLTRDQACKALGCSVRTLWRTLDRAGRDEVCVTLFGRTLIRKDKIPMIKEHYYGVGTKARTRMAKQWGASGGTTKARNRAAKRSS
jgi:hypothetical protein